MDDKLEDMEKAMRKYVKSLGLKILVKSSSSFKIGRVTYSWSIKKG